MTKQFLVDVYFLSAPCWGWTISPTEKIVEFIKTYDLSTFISQEQLDETLVKDSKGFTPIPMVSNLFGAINGFTHQNNVYSLYELWSKSLPKDDSCNIEAGYFVIYENSLGARFTNCLVLSRSECWVHFYSDGYFNEHSLRSCNKNHLISGICNKVIEEFKSLPFAAHCLFKYAIGAKDIRDVAPIFEYYSQNILDNCYDINALMDIAKRVIDSDKLALEFIYECLTNSKLFGLANSEDAVQPALNLFKALRQHI